MAAVTSPKDLEDGDEVITAIFYEKDSQKPTRSQVLYRKNENANATLLNCLKPFVSVKGLKKCLIMFFFQCYH